MIRRLKEIISSFFTWVGRTFDFSDFFGLIGLGGVFYGLYLKDPALAYIVVGVMIFLLSLLTSKKR